MLTKMHGVPESEFLSTNISMAAVWPDMLTTMQKVKPGGSLLMDSNII